jgi:threonine dehydrogenase-like Zn-dependent dehydrogenase
MERRSDQLHRAAALLRGGTEVKAWEFHDGELRLQTVDPPANDFVVDVRYSGICGSDIPKILDPQSFSLPDQWRPGHEVVGTDPSGQWVAVDPLVACGQCGVCAAGNSHLCPHLKRLGWDLPGGFAEQVSVPIGQIHALPADLDPLLAVLTDPAATAIHGLRCPPLRAPGRLAVIGAGTVGLLAALYAASVGWAVTVIHRAEKQPSATAFADILAFRSAAAVGGRQHFDVVVDAATGASATPLEQSLRLVADGGTVVVLNAYAPGVTLRTPLRDIFRRSIQLIGSFSYCRRADPDDFQAALQFLATHRHRLGPLVTEAGGLAELPKAIIDKTTGARRVLRIRAIA